MVIGAHTVGHQYPPYVIAELSANHGQCLGRALELVTIAAACGAQAVKLQTFTPDTLTLDSFKKDFFLPTAGSPWAGERLWDLYKKAYTPWEWHEPIFAAARNLGLGCISTAFDEASTKFLVELGVDAIKIASFELVHIPLIRFAASQNIPLILSTGMATYAEISEASSALRESTTRTPIFLKCTSAYPASPSDANLRVIPELERDFNAVVGVSDHTMSISVVAVAVSLGARVIEKHLTLSRGDGGPDSSFSLEPQEFKEVVSVAQECHLALGKITYGVQPSEQVSAWERPSIWVCRPVQPGEWFTEANLKIVRPSGGLHPREFGSVIGKKAACYIEAETPLQYTHISSKS